MAAFPDSSGYVTDKVGYVGDLSDKSLVNLEELLKRQKKLLANRRFLNTLPDKGQKIINFKDKLENELKNRSKYVDPVEEFEKLRISSVDVKNDESQEIQQDQPKYVNHYAEIMSRSEPSKPKFLPAKISRFKQEKQIQKSPIKIDPKETEKNSSIRDIVNLNTDIIADNTTDKISLEKDRKLCHKYDDLLEQEISASTRRTKLVSLSESARIIQNQNQYNQNFNSREAEDKLKSSKMVSFRMDQDIMENIQYREKEIESDNSEIDYPD